MGDGVGRLIAEGEGSGVGVTAWPGELPCRSTAIAAASDTQDYESAELCPLLVWTT
jgi:hypothetical protein